jgi:hypothetical protein
MEKFGLQVEDETLIAARIQQDPLSGRVLLHSCSALRALAYKTLASKRVDVFYVFFPNADIQLYGRDVAIVIGIDGPNSLSGGGLEPESVLRVMEMIAELTRYVIS